MKLKVAGLRRAALVGIVCTSSAALAQEAPSTPGVVLSWDVPTLNVDGSPLTDLQGFFVYEGSSPLTMLPVYETGATQPSIELPDGWPQPGVRYFAITAVNADGQESDLTGIVVAPAP